MGLQTAQSFSMIISICEFGRIRVELKASSNVSQACSGGSWTTLELLWTRPSEPDRRKIQLSASEVLHYVIQDLPELSERRIVSLGALSGQHRNRGHYLKDNNAAFVNWPWRFRKDLRTGGSQAP
jgi:hypothetical protein